MEINSSKLKLIFIGEIESSMFSGFMTLDESYDFSTTEIIIPDELFKPQKEKAIISFQLILKDTEKIKIKPELFHFNVFNGLNIAYCFITFLSEILFDICCLGEKVKVFNKNMELDQFNYLENDTRSRIILINAPQGIRLNKIYKPTLLIPLDMSDYNSIQISLFDSSIKNYSVKVISNEEFTEEFTLIKYLKEKKFILKNFYEGLEKLIEQNYEDIEIYTEYIAQIDLERIENNFSTRKDILNKAFNDNELFDLFYMYILWYICDLKYFPNEKNEKNQKNKEIKEKKENEEEEKKENEEEEKKEEIIYYNLSIIIVFKYIKEFYEKYKKDKDLLNYQKILLFYSNVIFFIRMDNEKKYNECKLEYVNAKNIHKNSVFGLSFKFLEDFINNLNSKSYLFYPLLLLDSGLYYKGEKPTYGFDFQSCDNVKEHLRDLLPDVFFTYQLDSIDNEKGFNYKGMKIVFLNRATVLNNYKGNPQEEDSNIKTVKHYAMRSSKLFMHECFGHNKFIYEQKEGIHSPKNFYDQDKRFITMVPKGYKYENSSINYYFPVNQRDGSVGESGNFLEYFFGLYKNELIIDLLYNFPDIGKLIDNVKYFTSEKLDILKKYIIYKYLIIENHIKYLEKENTDLEQDVTEMSKLLAMNKINIEEQKIDQIENIFDIKRKDDDSKTMFFEMIDESEIKGFSYYSKKLKEAKTKEESRRYAREIIFNYIKKV